MLLSEVWHLAEDELTTEGPEEGLHGELVHVLELKTHCDEVIVFDSIDFAPKDQLFNFNFGLQGAEGHLDLHALVEVESRAILLKVLDLLGEV